jgi:anthranilate 1,2-dioxygenase large subunit
VPVQILTIFPGMVCNRCAHDRGAGTARAAWTSAELEWIHPGFDTDDEAMTERRLRQGNLIGAAGYISMEDGCVGGFVQRALQYNDEGAGLVMMGGHEAESQTFRASEAAIRGFWKHYRTLMGE